jgi:hypothetical protein
MAGIFISYRSADGRAPAEAIYRDLATNFGPERVFLDKQAILPGVPYPREIRAWIRERCSVMLAVIGPVWLSALDDAGKRLLFRPHDWVHDEIADALKMNLPVLPVLIYETPLPAPEELPEDITGLVAREALRIGHFDNDNDLRNLAYCIEALDPDLAEAERNATAPDVPPWVSKASGIMRWGAAQIYRLAYTPQTAAPLITLTLALGTPIAAAADMLARMPERKAAAILEAMGRSRAVPILREMNPDQRRMIMDYLPASLRYLMTSDTNKGRNAHTMPDKTDPPGRPRTGN